MRKSRPAGARKPDLPPPPVLPGKLLAVDLGSRRCGWAWASVDAAGRALERDSGVLPLEDLSQHRWKRVDYYAKWLTRMVEKSDVTWIAQEEPFTGKDNVGTRHLLHGLYMFGDVISGRRLGQVTRPISRFDVFEATVGWKQRALSDEELAAAAARRQRQVDAHAQDRRRRPPKAAPKRRPMRCPTKAEIMAAVNARHANPKPGMGHGRLFGEDEADAVAMLDMLLAELAGTGPGFAYIYDNTGGEDVVELPTTEVAKLQAAAARMPQLPLLAAPETGLTPATPARTEAGGTTKAKAAAKPGKFRLPDHLASAPVRGRRRT